MADSKPLDLSFNPNLQFSPPLLFLPIPSFSHLMSVLFNIIWIFATFPPFVMFRGLVITRHVSSIFTLGCYLSRSFLFIYLPLFDLLIYHSKNKKTLDDSLILSLFFSFANDGFLSFHPRSYYNEIIFTRSVFFSFSPSFHIFALSRPLWFVLAALSFRDAWHLSFFYSRVLLLSFADAKTL